MRRYDPRMRPRSAAFALVLAACGPVIGDGDTSGDGTTGNDTSTSTRPDPSATDPSPTDPSPTASGSTSGTMTTTVGTATVSTTADPSDADVATTDTPKLDIATGCGDGAVDPGELCDGDDLQEFSCRAFGYAGGDLACREDCTFDTSFCVGSDSDSGDACGDGEVNPGEQCDGDDLQGFTCEALGLGGGVLTCDFIMCTFDTSMCNA